MPTYKVTDPTTGKTITLTGDSPPTESELTDIFANLSRNAPASPQAPPSAPQGDALLTNLKNVAMAPLRAVGAVKDFAVNHPAQAGGMALGGAMSLATGGLGAVPAMGLVGLAGAGGAGLGDAISQVANRDTAPLPTVTGNLQDMAIQGAAGAGAEGLGRGIQAAVNAIPSSARAGANFQQVMGAAKDLPVTLGADVNDAALRAAELGTRGSQVPKVVTQFIKVVDNADQQPLTYEAARDFASNLGRLSTNDYQKMTPIMAAQVARLSASLNAAVADTARQAGQGAAYRAAMTEYARAKTLQNAIDAATSGAKRAIPYASAGAAGYWLTSQVRRLLGN